MAELVVQEAPWLLQLLPLKLQIHVSAAHTYGGQANKAHLNEIGKPVMPSLR